MGAPAVPKSQGRQRMEPSLTTLMDAKTPPSLRPGPAGFTLACEEGDPSPDLFRTLLPPSRSIFAD
jgi:hypothetical protein